jgi:hypothetical protein
MTLCIAAKFKHGTMLATDLAVSSSGTKRLLTDGKWFDVDEGVAMYAGTLYYVQEVEWASGPIRSRLQEVREVHKDDDDSDDCELLVVDSAGKSIRYFEHYGSSYECGDFGTIGNGGDLADGLLEMVYTPGRSEAWLRSHLGNIFRIVSRKVDGVSAEHKIRVLP